MSEQTILVSGLVMGESPRWHDGRLWVCDWGEGEVIAVDLAGQSEVVARVPSLPICIDWLPDGSLLVVSGGDGRLLRQEPDGSLVSYADLATLLDRPWNEITTDARGNAYVNTIGFDFPGEPAAPETSPSSPPTPWRVWWPTASSSQTGW